MDVQIAGDGGFDLVEEFAELAGAMTGVALADDARSRRRGICSWVVLYSSPECGSAVTSRSADRQ